MAQAPQPMFINIPPPSANQEPSDLPYAAFLLSTFVLSH